MGHRWVLCVLSYLISCVFAQNVSSGTDYGFSNDPILQFRPAFARSLPVQILLVGIVLTLSSVLLLHLIFTAQYHWPLAPVNFALQLSAVSILLISSIVTLQVVLSTATEQSRVWPYMLNYVAVDLPPTGTTDWPISQVAGWLLMNATTSVLIQITHIQFLTLLFPSTLERRLIFCLLGPLACLSAVMQMLRIHEGSKLEGLASAVQNVCNATLSLLFTGSLFVWGFLVNRKQAWRTDGGTAAFGAGALTLAPMSTAISFLYVPSKDQYTWMPPLMWSVILWQSFLGWWWWVGAGMGVGEIDERLQREEKRRRKRKMRLARRQVRRERAETLWKGVTGAFGFSRQPGAGEQGEEGEEAFDLARRRTRGRRRSSAESDRSAVSAGSDASKQPSSASTLTNASSSSGMFAQLWNHPAGRYMYGWFLHVRHAHLTAAREQAVEQVERINQVYGKEGGENSTNCRSAVGWGLGSFGTKRSVQRQTGQVNLDGNYEMEPVKKPRVGRGKENPEDDVQRVHVEEGRLPDTQQARMHRPTSMWWWGPLQRWRLQDATVY
ncbi:hypothetical protein BKA93DRAFT_825209 [Sparassis latifolia]|uniref:Uncharacterized protein n=1 Tax=Sparassis crispa TaxID=139825 RepID=A0A401GF13_9APHY|nr:hypothetical protein SCP_0304780 [Sparassis crispa]GBE80759.1 hypothetical protein SCP_0304780 [Sparassis crispa]